jgi:hypothetical protein
MPPIDLDDGTGVYFSYGWPATELPNFAAIESEQPPEPERRKVNTKTENSTLAIVGALRAIIMGELSVKPHPEFASETQLIDFLSDKLKTIPGMSRRNLQDKFARAKRLIKPT